MADFHAGESLSNGSNSTSHSRESSMSSERSQNKENTQTNTLTRRDSDSSDLSDRQLILRDGGVLAEESRTEIGVSGVANHGYENIVRNGNGEHSSGNPVELPPRQPTAGGVVGTARHRVNKSGNLASSIPEEEIAIPNDGNLASFSADAMATFFRYLRVEDRLINHLHRNGLDGKKFGRLKDTDLENLLLKNPVVIYFRDRTAPAVSKKPKQRLPFVL